MTAPTLIAGVTSAQSGCGYSATPRLNLGDQAVEMSLPIADLGAVIDRIISRHGDLILEVGVFVQANNAAALAARYAQVLETKYGAAASAHSDLTAFVNATKS
jgi:hypothetical protein